MFEFIAKQIVPPMAPVDNAEVMVAWGKIDRVVDSAFQHSHLDVAQTMLDNMLKHFKFTPEQMQSPLVIGMREKIYKARTEVI